LLAASAAIGIGIAAVQLIPTFEFSRLSNRSGALSYELATRSGQLWPRNLITAFWPDAYGTIRGPYRGLGDIVHSSVYVGIAPLVLIGAAFVRPLSRSVVVFAAMVASCVVSGLAGALIPLTLRRFGADPATASSIFLTTATDVASMGLFLSLATLFVR